MVRPGEDGHEGMTFDHRVSGERAEALRARGRAVWRAEQRRAIIGRVVRWIIGLSLLMFCFPIPWAGPCLMLLGAILISPELVNLFSWLAGIFCPPNSRSRPGPLYSIPETLVARGKYAEAEEEYEKIIREFPAELKPHIDLINIAVMRLNDGELAEKLYQRGLSVLRDAQSKETLEKMYSSISTRLKTASSSHRAPAIARPARKE